MVYEIISKWLHNKECRYDESIDDEGRFLFELFMNLPNDRVVKIIMTLDKDENIFSLLAASNIREQILYQQNIESVRETVNDINQNGNFPASCFVVRNMAICTKYLYDINEFKIFSEDNFENILHKTVALLEFILNGLDGAFTRHLDAQNTAHV
jgi:hypothetical protein